MVIEAKTKATKRAIVQVVCQGKCIEILLLSKNINMFITGYKHERLSCTQIYIKRKRNQT